MRPGIATLLVAAALAALGPGCGKSKEEERFEFIETTCRAMVGKTIRQAEQELSLSAFIAGCRSDRTPVAGQVCTPDVSLCIAAWNFLANDRAVCSSFGCYFGCGARVEQTDLAANGDGAVICGVQFVSGNPVPPFQ
jgi:hypothetical protein